MCKIIHKFYLFHWESSAAPPGFFFAATSSASLSRARAAALLSAASAALSAALHCASCAVSLATPLPALPHLRHFQIGSLAGPFPSRCSRILSWVARLCARFERAMPGGGGAAARGTKRGGGGAESGCGGGGFGSCGRRGVSRSLGWSLVDLVWTWATAVGPVKVATGMLCGLQLYIGPKYLVGFRSFWAENSAYRRTSWH